jgi:hypothetical protein
LFSAKRLSYIERHPIFDDVVTSPTQLVGHRLDSQYTMSLGFLSLVEFLNPRMKTDREVGRFDKGPGQILIAVLGIAAAFAFAVADFLTAYTAAVGSKVSDARKSPDVAGLQHDGQCQNLPNPRNGLNPTFSTGWVKDQKTQ